MRLRACPHDGRRGEDGAPALPSPAVATGALVGRYRKGLLAPSRLEGAQKGPGELEETLLD